MVINIVCTHLFRMKIQNHPKYQMDLGKKYTKKIPNGLDINIEDTFILEYLSKTNELVYKVGRLGPINLYTSAHISDDTILIFKDGNRFERKINMIEMEIDFEKYLAQLLISIQDN